VVDLACGTGFVARVAAARVGDTGHVVGVDINPLMVAEARRVTGLPVIEAPAESTGLPGSRHDAVFCQQGIQYVTEPAALLQEARRLFRPGGRILLSVWSDFDRNPFRAGQLAAMEPYLTPSPVDAFRRTSVRSLGGADGLATLLEDAGLSDISVEEREREVSLPAMRSYFPSMVAATPWKDAVERLTTPQRDAVLDRLDAFVVPDPVDTGCSVQMSVTVAAAIRPPARPVPPARPLP
jgi:SAM-dependent methyltransferase